MDRHHRNTTVLFGKVNIHTEIKTIAFFSIFAVLFKRCLRNDSYVHHHNFMVLLKYFILQKKSWQSSLSCCCFQLIQFNDKENSALQVNWESNRISLFRVYRFDIGTTFFSSNITCESWWLLNQKMGVDKFWVKCIASNAYKYVFCVVFGVQSILCSLFTWFGRMWIATLDDLI